jgi:hypothetical protein
MKTASTRLRTAALIEELAAYIKLDPDSPAGVRALQLLSQVQGSPLSVSATAPAAGARQNISSCRKSILYPLVDLFAQPRM